MRSIRGTASRTVRRINVTARDVDLLHLVGLCPHISVQQLGREFFPPHSDRAMRRVRDLLDAGFVRVTAVPQRSGLVALTPKGLAEVERRHGEDPRLQTGGAVALQSVDHRLAVYDARLWCSALAGVGFGELVGWHSGRSDLAAVRGLTTATLVPDGLADWQTPNGPLVACIEVDIGSERLDVLARKFQRYRPLTRASEFEVWVVAVGTPGRMDRIADAAAAAGIGKATNVLALLDLQRRPVVLPMATVSAAGGFGHTAEILTRRRCE